MKIIRIALVAAACFTGSIAFSQNIVTNEQIQVTINGTTSREELGNLRYQLEALGIEFHYLPQFNNERKLTGIHYKLRHIGQETYFTEQDQQGMQTQHTYTKFTFNKVNNQWNLVCAGTCTESGQH
jgi:ABC-type hemin transport system substrate-binding protein